LASDVAAAFFDAVVRQAREAGLLSDEHFTVDSTQLEAWASLKTVGLMRKLRHRGGERVDWMYTFTAAAYNLVRLRTLGAASW
jgi:hypothetical protein